MGKQNRLSTGIYFNVSAKQRHETESAPVFLSCGCAAKTLDVSMLEKKKNCHSITATSWAPQLGEEQVWEKQGPNHHTRSRLPLYPSQWQ